MSRCKPDDYYESKKDVLKKLNSVEALLTSIAFEEARGAGTARYWKKLGVSDVAARTLAADTDQAREALRALRSVLKAMRRPQ